MKELIKLQLSIIVCIAISLSVSEVLAAPITIDNGDSGTTALGEWKVSGAANPFGADSLWSRGFGDIYTYQAALSGSYEVYLKWTAYSTRCTSVPVEIYDGAIFLDRVFIDQQSSGLDFVYINTYSFTGAASVDVRSVDDSCSTSADAVQFISDVPLELDSVLIEGPVDVNENTVTDYTFRAYYTNGTDRALEPDNWEVDCPTEASISETGLLATNEIAAAVPCTIIATYTEDSIERSDTHDITIHDYVPPSELIIDNGDSGTTAAGVWDISGAANPFGADSLWSRGFEDTYTYQAALTGSYDVYLKWTALSSRCTNVPVEIYDGTTLLDDTVAINQQLNGLNFEYINTYLFTGAAIVDVISVDNGCSTSADAVQFIKEVPPELDYVLVEGPADVNENTETDYTFRAYYTNGTDRTLEPGSWEVDCPTEAGISETGLLTTNEVAADVSCIITAIYTEDSVERSDMHDITIHDFVPSALASVVIEGPVSVDENSATDYTFRAYYTNGTDQVLGPDSWAVACPADEAIISTAGLLTTNEVAAEVSCIITATYTEDSVERSDTHDITIHDYVSPPELIIDNGDSGTTAVGDWIVSGAANPLGANSLYSKGFGDTYSYEAPLTGAYEVHLKWTYYSSRCTNVPVKIYDGTALLDTISINQQLDGLDFVYINTYSFTGTAIVAVGSVDDSCSTSADAVKYAYPEPFISINNPLSDHLQTSSDLLVDVNIRNLETNWGVKFILNEGAFDESVIIDKTVPFETVFANITQAEHTLDAYIIDDSDALVNGPYSHDSVNNIGYGAYYIALGDSITDGEGDDFLSDNISLDGRNIGGGFEPILNDMLTGFFNIPHTVINEGQGGAVSAYGLSNLPSILDHHPEAVRYLVMYGTNDARPWLPVPSGYGLSSEDPDYPGTYKDNMQQIIDLINGAGKEIYLAKPPITLGNSTNSVPYPDPDSGARSVLIKEYNDVIDEFYNTPANGITIVPPDFYALFYEYDPIAGRYRYEDEYTDNLHPNGLGYTSMSDLWFQHLTQ